ncbi:30S ribosomal subunit protein S17 [Candidatus Vidania fulgoroideae]|nr:30S ribosomal subunit protein S17 [Candidatus Vidania fulgoroideae]
MKVITCFIKKISSKNTLSAFYFYYKKNTKLKKKVKRKRSILVNFKCSFYKEGMKILVRPIRKISSKKSWELIKVLG